MAGQSDYSNLPIGSAVMACPDKKKHWIEIELVDQDGKPAAYEEYRVRLPDGATASGRLDAKGKTRVEGIDNPGQCKVTFPKRDKRAWDAAARK